MLFRSGLFDASAICLPLSASASEVTPCATDIDSRAVSVRGEAFSRHEPPYQLLLAGDFPDLSLGCDGLLADGVRESIGSGVCAVSCCRSRFCASGIDWLGSVGCASGSCVVCRDFLRAGAMCAKMARRASRRRCVLCVSGVFWACVHEDVGC